MKLAAAVMLLFSALAASPLPAQTSVPMEGNPKSAVRVVIYEDLQCPDCAAFRHMLDTGLYAKYKDRVAFEHRDFPLPKHKWALPAARVARGLVLIDPKLASEFRRETMNSIPKLDADSFPAYLDNFAKAHHLDPAKLRAMRDDAELAKLVEADVQEGIARGVSKTPTVFVNGQPFVETFTVEEISKGIDAAIAEAGQ